MSEAKQTLLFYPKKTIYFHYDDRKTSIEFDGYRYHFDNQDKRLNFLQDLQTAFPNSREIGIRGKIKYPYRPQVAALVVLNACFWIALSGKNSYDGSYSGRYRATDAFIDLIMAMPREILLLLYFSLTIAIVYRIIRNSDRFQHETIIEITKS